MNRPQSNQLSPEGIERREIMLDALLREVERTCTLRRTRRRATAVLLCVGLTVFTARFMMPAAGPALETDRTVVESSQPGALDVPRMNAEKANPTARGAIVSIVRTTQPSHVVVVQSDPAVFQRFTAERTTHIVQKMDDSTLLTTLASIHRPAGLIRIGGHVRLSRPVSDAELALANTVPQDHIR